MSDLTPNDRQRDLIERTDGLSLVDAGPGTGKTFTISRRYVEIISQPDVEPEDVLLVTFTRSAATEMTERIVDRSEDYETHELADAPIQTFHSHCYDILKEHGYAVPTHLGIDDRITNSTRIIEEELVEKELFREFVGQFRDDHPEHADVFRALSDPTELLDVINQLAAKGVFPTEAGWYRDGEAHLDGDFEAFKERFDAVNRPRNNGRKQSELREKLTGFGKSKTHLPDAPSRSRIRGSGTKQVPHDVAEMAFHEDRGQLKAFVHDVYFEYLRFALRRNYLNFGFLQLFAFVLLCENDALRDSLSFEYVMIDEFQDSSEIQFKLALLLADTNNLCVVGDWKQSIYSFQYAAVENIQHFEERLERFIDDLNRDRERVQFDTGAVERIQLTQNYRSTDSLIRFSEHALVTPATANETVDEAILDDVVTLESNAAVDNSTIEAIAHEDEHEAVLAKIQGIVGNDEYAIEDEDGDLRQPTPGDIAVLTRTRDFGRELLSVADDHAVSLSYDGGVELFRTDPAKCLLAWLRILEDDADRGWAVVLERAGYTLDEIDHVLETAAYPSNLAGFREELADLESVGTVARRVFDRYGMQSEYADVILHLIQSLHDTTTLTRGHLLQFIERGIENGSTHDVHTSAGDDSVTVQTIHSVKGLEYPIVILANMNEGTFPPRTRDSGVIQYQEPVGLRARTVYSEGGAFPHVYDRWQYDVYRHCLGNDYDEERRLLYVAITRAENHVCFVGGEDPNTFLEALPPDVTEAETTIGPGEAPTTAQMQLPFAVSPPDGPTGYSPHSLMDEAVFDEAGELDDGEGRGTDFGSQVHDFAEASATETDVTPSNPDERRVKEFLDGREGELIVEENAILPLTIDGDRVAISGIVDLVHVRPEGVEIIDYKTDRSRRAHDEYRKQVSVYYHVLQSQFPDREVSASLFYTHDGEQVTIEPMDRDELERIVRDLSVE